ncbi:TPA: hypothetical protein N0F65_001127 [Lagenidium giganteum]|uniref:Glyoxylate reductase/hydroxypyruvate reductase n=1 Tax=Lagenidium giganteum TaxID=4803 RepID=A0AAV2YHD7_9STRA|nr:TPA: hypothetical protein N0F65_001127 [Lagenidium giganteum]
MSAIAKKRVFFTRHIPYAVEQFKRLLGPTALQHVDIACHSSSDHAIPRDELLRQVAGAHGLFCLLTDRIDEELLAHAGPALTVVSTMSVGCNHVDVAACTARGVRVGYTPGVLDVSTAETAVALTFAAKRRVLECAGSARQGEWGVWQPFQYCGSDISDCTVGIVGLGRIGATYAKMMQRSFNCRVLYTGPRRKPDMEQLVGSDVQFVPELAALLEQSDIVSVHVPLSEATRNLIDAECLAKMKPSAVLINTSRGEVVDQDALVHALKAKTIAGAGLDVTSPEPLPPSHELFQIPSCVVLPHIGSATVKTRQAMADIAVRNLIAGLQDEPLPHQFQ